MLTFEEFDVYMIFGFSFSPELPIFNTWFDSKLDNAVQSSSGSGWTPMYMLPGGVDTLIRDSIKEMGKSISLPINISRPNLWGTADSANMPIQARVSYSYALKSSGDGTLRIRITCDKPSSGDNKKLCTPDILAVLLLAPRTEYGVGGESKLDQELSKVELRVGNNTVSLGEKLQDLYRDKVISQHASQPEENITFSPAFQLFLIGMCYMCKNLAADINRDMATKPSFRWNEFIYKTIPESDRWHNSLYYGTRRDPQIPYFYIVGTLPKDIYSAAFASSSLSEADFSEYQELLQVRRRYTKDIGAILHRWLIDANIQNVSYDQLEREGITKDGVVLSHYMNSLLFTTYSGTCALTFQPAIDVEKENGVVPPEQVPFEPAVHSILNFIEYSRMRWHQCISINRDLDTLVDRVRDATDQDIENVMADLYRIRLIVAKSMQNPMTYRWDATVGTAVGKYIHLQVIAELETATERKLSLIKEVLIDRLDMIQSKAILSRIHQ